MFTCLQPYVFTRGTIIFDPKLHIMCDVYFASVCVCNFVIYKYKTIIYLWFSACTILSLILFISINKDRHLTILAKQYRSGIMIELWWLTKSISNLLQLSQWTDSRSKSYRSRHKKRGVHTPCQGLYRVSYFFSVVAIFNWCLLMTCGVTRAYYFEITSANIELTKYILDGNMSAILYLHFNLSC